MNFYRYSVFSNRIVLEEFEVLRETPKGHRLVGGKFILKAAKKKFACPTIQDARESFIYRKRKYIEILTRRLNENRAALALAEAGKLPESRDDFTFTVVQAVEPPLCLDETVPDSILNQVEALPGQ